MVGAVDSAASSVLGRSYPTAFAEAVAALDQMILAAYFGEAEVEGPELSSARGSAAADDLA